MVLHIRTRGEPDSPAHASKEELIEGAKEEKKNKRYYVPPGLREKARWARLSVVSNFGLLIAKLTIGIYIMSISVISEGLHTSIDLIAAMLAAYSVQKAVQPADKDHKFGHGKYENVSGTLEAILIFAISLVIIYEACQKIYYGVGEIDVNLGIYVMLVSTVVNYFVARKLHQVAKKHDSIAIEADAYHLSADVWTSLGVFIGLIIIKVGQSYNVANIGYIDPVFAIIIAAIIIRTAWDLTRRSLPGLLDGSLPEHEEKVIRRTIERHYSSFVEYHELRSRKAGAERHIDLHLVVARNITVERAHEICDRLEKEICGKLPNTKIIIHTEPCEEKCDECKFEKTRNGDCEEKTKMAK